MPLYAGKYAICTFLQNMLRSHDRYKPVSLNNTHICQAPHGHSFRGAGDRWRATVGRLA